MTKPSGNIAIFDLDYTLTKRGTWGRFVWMNVRTRPYLWLPLLVSAGLTQWQYKKGKRPRIDVKMAMMRWTMAGKSKKQLTNLAEKFAQNEVENGLRPGGIKAVKDHHEAGDTIIIVSAAVDIIVDPIARSLNIPYALATDMAWNSENKLSPNFASKNCYGPEKVNRLKALFDENPGLKQNHTIITMYSDSYSDLEILQFCDVGVGVNPDKRLRAQANSLGFRVEDWN